ncbi:hypothetical protein [Pseudomonas savastanoi]|uniref:Pentapeptide MXKDX repeat protein n=1 Tax=Pseudomonas savastanoi TaxID=29438 RepID=A0A3M6AMK0_PSESS|nr:hypothetical protein [Pseudomonas savastanoi]KPX02910.1 recombinase RecF [Pseudomonas syringae pv. cunninghamiae]RMV20511.1 hypothetical protein ALP16_200003 [Pseudomonas savastanoi]
MSKFVSSALITLLLSSSVLPLAFAEDEVAKGIRHDNRELDKGVDHDAKEVDKGVKHDDEERHKADKHLDKEAKKHL